jgi:hypothetical protein
LVEVGTFSRIYNEDRIKEHSSIPLKEKFGGRPSDIWNTQRAFLPGEWIKKRHPVAQVKLL